MLRSLPAGQARGQGAGFMNPPDSPPGLTLRLILGDQLNPLHSWFASPREDVRYVMMEIRQETDYVLHHAQKILAIFAGMRDLCRQLRAAGHEVTYLAIDDPHNRHTLSGNLLQLVETLGATSLEYQAPDEWRLDDELARLALASGVPVRRVDSEHFYTGRDEVARLFAGRKSWLMETFYRQMRLRYGVLLDAARQPLGGQWNFDHDNRQPWRGQPPEPPDGRPRHDHSALWQAVQAAGVRSVGEPEAEALAWPLNRAEALQQLEVFIDTALPHFGDFQDAMSSQASRLFHSMLSFALNSKMLGPREVVDRAQEAYAAGHAPLAAVEGFIRQILGWREYVRGVYWARMPGYAELNVLGHSTPLPVWFWTGHTRMRCLSLALGQTLQTAHAHHIQRLMVIGNFALLAGLDPQAVHRWYLGVYVDAFEWVELPNTLGMSQFADGGLLATKPYVSSAAYIDRMGDYCKGCAYDRKQRLGEGACPFNALYWDFFDRHAPTLQKNPRIGMAYRQLERMTPEALQALRERATALRRNLDTL